MSTKPKKLKAAEVQSIVLKFLQNNCRPYNQKQVLDAVSDKDAGLGNAALEKALNSLVESGDVKTKTVKKVSLFWINQDNVETLSDKDLQKVDEEIQSLQTVLLDHDSQLKETTSTLKALMSEPKNEELDVIIAELKKTIEANKERLEKAKDGKSSAPKQSKEDISKALDHYKSIRRKRKSMYMDISDSIQENLGPAKMKKIREEIDFQMDSYTVENAVTTAKGRR